MTNTDVPKLCLDNASNSEDEAVYTAAKGENHSSSSGSTVSWGTESLADSCRNSFRRPAVYPPWATHLPLDSSFSQMEKKKLGSIRDDDKQLSSSLGDVTQRVCSDLENKWKAESIGDFSGHAEITTRNCTSRDVGSVVTPKQLIDYSIRNTPGLCRPSKQSVDHLSSGGDVQHNLNNRIWFTARLLVFDTSDIIQEEKQSKYASDMDWTNSISSFALRSFIGIGFPSDSTWALYEDHKTGVSSKPLPFLRRSMYHCVWGSRCGQTYLPEVDLFPGAILFVRYSDEYKAPTPLRKFLHYTGNVLRILITGVDRSAKRKAIESEFSRQKVPEDQWFSVIAKLHVARLLVRPRHLMQLFKLQCLWRQDLRKRSSPVEAYLNLGLIIEMQ
ncbi:unnamed protein product [Heterobilharzia americana]|nr:unnamed protein product [Heterobilharzia americana]